VTEEHTSASEPQGVPHAYLAEVLSEMARSLQAQPDLQRTVEGIVTAVTTTVPGAEDAGVSVRDGAKLRTVAATSELVQRLNGIEHDLGEGLCVQAELKHRVYRIDDMAHETRWPRFAAAAADAGIQSMLGFRLFITGRTLGALDLYSSKANAFDTDAELIGELFAAHAAVAMIGSTQQAEWKTALGTRDVIGMAKGILMQREHLTDDGAFDLLARTSQTANIKVQDIAGWLVAQANEDVRAMDHGQRRNGSPPNPGD
jgi:transcriptional regulator with GAF, ATPase, and Fis domain